MAEAERDRDAANATLALQDAVRLWRLNGASHVSELIDAATDCLVADLDSPSLRILAGASPRDSMYEIEPLILATLSELGYADLLDTNVQREALCAMLRRLKRGAITPRDLAAWAHTNIGHAGPADCQPLVVLDDMFDDVEYLGYLQADLDSWTHAEADALLEGRPSPGTTKVYGTPIAVSRPSASRLRRWLTRRSR